MNCYMHRNKIKTQGGYIMQTTQTARQITLEDIYDDIKSMKEEMIDKLELIRFKLIDAALPVEGISDEEKEELDRLEKEPGRRLEDVLAELDV